jgi:hypothetical protein
MKKLLIPFGVHRETGEYTDPEDAINGRKCDCLCPGCEAPLKAIHPSVKRAHFAHDSRHPEFVPERECPLSSVVALAMMMRHVGTLCVGKQFELNPYEIIVPFPCCPGSYEHTIVSDVPHVQVNEVVLDPTLGETTFDLRLKVGERYLYVDLYHHNKPAKTINPELHFAERSGVVGINCDEFYLWMHDHDNAKQKYSELVLSNLLSATCKEWLYHPRQDAAIAIKKSSHKCKLSQSRNTYPTGDSTNHYVTTHWQEQAPAYVPIRHEPVKVKCVVCLSVWDWVPGTSQACTGCKTHLYVVAI